ncbi:S-formylglutathione hydrolase [Gammaproteobacteria bacterium]|nr:S-formylglutathione hydrolase [Gammaproteobacteria bacterium]
MEKVSSNRSFKGVHEVWSHDSVAASCKMTFSIYLPDNPEGQKQKTLIWLSGLTCTEENFRVKSGVQSFASEHNMIIVSPDTSPRGDDVPDDPNYDFAQGAGFYLDATEKPWSKNYNMYSYIVDELVEIIKDHFPVDANRLGISGHSMGGHGALTIAIKNPDIFKSVSAFSPICNPTKIPWGEKAFTKYLGKDENIWNDYDACSLIKSRGFQSDILIDQGEEDEFLADQLKPESFVQACEEKNVEVSLRMQPGFDHSYFFIATFIQDHIDWHSQRL